MQFGHANQLKYQNIISKKIIIQSFKKETKTEVVEGGTQDYNYCYT